MLEQRGTPSESYFKFVVYSLRFAFKARKEELLPVLYFHVVFMLPEQINRLCLFAAANVYDALFATAWSTIAAFAGDPKHLAARSM